MNSWLLFYKRPLVVDAVLETGVSTGTLEHIISCWPTRQHLENFLQLRTMFTLNLFSEALDAATDKMDCDRKNVASGHPPWDLPHYGPLAPVGWFRWCRPINGGRRPEAHSGGS